MNSEIYKITITNTFARETFTNFKLISESLSHKTRAWTLHAKVYPHEIFLSCNLWKFILLKTCSYFIASCYAKNIHKLWVYLILIMLISFRPTITTILQAILVYLLLRNTKKLDICKRLSCKTLPFWHFTKLSTQNF